MKKGVLWHVEEEALESSKDSLGAFHLFGKTGRSGGKSNGTGLSTGNFSEKKEYLQPIILFANCWTKIFTNSKLVSFLPYIQDGKHSNETIPFPVTIFTPVFSFIC